MIEDQSTETAQSAAANIEYSRAKSRRRLTVAAVLILASAAIYFGPHSKTVYYAEHTEAFADKRYKAGMLALKEQNYDEAEKLFGEALGAGDARGSFGIACVIYRSELPKRHYADGPASLRTSYAFDQLQYASDQGVYPARVALVGYLVRAGSTDALPLISSLLKAAKNRTLPIFSDPTMPEFNLAEQVGIAPRTTISTMLQQSFCGPPISPERAEMLIDQALSTSKD